MPKSITRQQALGYVKACTLERAIAAGKVKEHPEEGGRTIWFRLSEILELNESLTAK